MFSISPPARSSNASRSQKFSIPFMWFFTVSEFIFRVLHSVVSFGSIINQAIIGFPAIKVYSIRYIAIIGLSSLTEQFFNYLGIDLAVSFKHTEYRLLSASSSTLLASYSPSSALFAVTS